MDQVELKSNNYYTRGTYALIGRTAFESSNNDKTDYEKFQRVRNIYSNI